MEANAEAMDAWSAQLQEFTRLEPTDLVDNAFSSINEND